MTRPRSFAAVTIARKHRAREVVSEDSDLSLLDAYYHERAMDAVDDPRWNAEWNHTEQSEQSALLAELLALSPRRV